MTRNIERTFVAACIVAIVVVVAPVLRTNYLGDDAFNSYIPGWIGYERLSLPHAYSLLYQGTNVSAGRFYPLYPLLLLALYTVVRSLFVVKLLQIIFIVLNALTFYVLAKRVGAGRAGALFALAALPLSFSFRDFHDAILQFSLHFPLTLEFILLALLAGNRYLISGSRRMLVCAGASWAAACLLYDGVYPLVITFLVMAFGTQAPVRKHRVALAGVALGIVGILGAVASWQRLTHATTVATYQAHLAPIALSTYGAQTAAALPLNYYLANPTGFFPNVVTLWHRGAALAVEALLAFVIALVLGFACRKYFRGDPVAPRRAAAVGASLWLLPGVLIAVAARYQDEIRFGLGHTPVYIEAYGVALLFGLLLSQLALRSRFAIVPVACALSFLYGTNAAANALTLARYGGWDHPRRTLTAALHAGILRDAASGSTLYVDHSTPINDQYGAAWWDPRFFYYAQTGKRYDVRPVERETSDAIVPGSHDLRVQSPEGVPGAVIVSRLEARSLTPPVPTVDTAYIFEQDLYERTPHTGNRFQPHDFRTLDVTPKGSLFAFASACRHLPVDALPSDSPAPIALVWGDGFSVEERNARSTWHWAAATAGLHLISTGSHPLQPVFHSVLAATARASHAWVTTMNHTVTVALGTKPHELLIPIAITPGHPVDIRFRSDAPRADAPGDTRDLRLQVRDTYVSGNC